MSLAYNPSDVFLLYLLDYPCSQYKIRLYILNYKHNTWPISLSRVYWRTSSRRSHASAWRMSPSQTFWRTSSRRRFATANRRRRGRDLNPRYRFRYSSFQDWSVQPLRHLSNVIIVPISPSQTYWRTSSRRRFASTDRRRRGRDSNPGTPCGVSTLAVCCFRPLSHLSNTSKV